MMTKPPKKKKRPNFMWQSMERKPWAIIKVNNMLTETFTAWPADRISRGQISLGINHPNGPQDHANAATYAHIKNNIKLASNEDYVPIPLTPNFKPIMMPIAI